MTHNHALRRQIGADLLLLLVTLVWGGTFVMVKGATADYPIFPFLTLRFGLATGVLLLLGAWRLGRLGWRGWGMGALLGLALFAGYALQTLGLRYTSASKSGLITGLSVVMVPLLAAWLLRRRPSAAAYAGVALATTGLVLLTLGDAFVLAPGDLLLVGCALGFALHIVGVSAFAPRTDVLALTIVQLATVTLICGAISLFAHQPWPATPQPVWFAAAFTGILATAAAFLAQTAMQRFTTPTHTALVFAAEPVFAALFGVWLSGDVLSTRGIMGGVLIVLGNLISEIPWSERTAVWISRYLAPQYVLLPLLVIVGLADGVVWWQGLLWAAGIAVVALVAPLLLMQRELRAGRISDWHLSNRHERLRPMPILIALFATAAPLALLVLLRGPHLLLVTSVAAVALFVINLAITFAWKISQHVAAIAASATLVTVTVGLAAAPVLLLIPIMAWARVRVGAHTRMQTLGGALSGVLITLATVTLIG